MVCFAYSPLLRLSLSSFSLFACWFQPWLISQPTMFFSHNKPAPAELISLETNQRTCHLRDFIEGGECVGGGTSEHLDHHLPEHDEHMGAHGSSRRWFRPWNLGVSRKRFSSARKATFTEQTPILMESWKYAVALASLGSLVPV